MEAYRWQLGKSGRRGENRKILTGDIFSCAFCDGSGTLPRSKRTVCPVCRGAGTVRVEPPALVCAYCGGKGEANPRTNITCIVCRGKGVVAAREPIRGCRACQGTGVEAGSKLPCLACRGKGVVQALVQAKG